jgi:hypothetical protein
VSEITLPDRSVQLPPGVIPVPAQELFVVAQEYLEAGRPDAAERMLGHVLAGMPNQPEALHLLGLIAHRRGRLAEASALVEQSIAHGGNKATPWRNLSELYRLQARLDDALTAGRRAVSLDPADALSLFNLALVLYDRLEIDACEASARAALDLKPSLPQGHLKLAQALLAQGKMAEGWEEYEWRYQIPGAAPLMPKTDRPQWNGAPLGEERLLLIADQGYGDVVQFARYIPWVLERCPNIVIACSAELIPLIDWMYPGLPTLTRWDDLPPYAAFCPFSGLPRLHGTRLDTIPQAVPYLCADPARVEAWRGRLAEMLPAGLKRVGLVWAGRPTHNNDVNRTVALAALSPLGAVPGVAFVSLQKGPAAAQIGQFAGPAPLLNLDAQIKSFEDTAAILECLDLLICVDTSVGHIAGALGRPAWIMLPFAPDWRWLLGRSDTPWYPSLRLFRPPAPRRWDAVIAEVAASLADFAAT